MPKTTLAEARIKAPGSRKTAYDIRDGNLKGFGVRVMPSGRKRFFVHCQHRGERFWRIVGDAGTLDVGGARSRAAESLAAIRRGEEAPCEAHAAQFEVVAGTVMRRHERVRKPHYSAERGVVEADVA